MEALFETAIEDDELMRCSYGEIFGGGRPAPHEDKDLRVGRRHRYLDGSRRRGDLRWGGETSSEQAVRDERVDANRCPQHQ